jgi:hypothetical protein
MSQTTQLQEHLRNAFEDYGDEIFIDSAKALHTQATRITELEARWESDLASQALADLEPYRKDAERYQWIPVSERLPDEGMEVIAYTPPLNGEDEQYTFEKYEDECFIAHSNNYEHFCMVAKGGSDCAWIGPSEKPKYTHWIPMLTAPAIAEGKQA